MKPLEFHSPTSVEEAVSLLAGQGDNAGALSGGTDLIIQYRAGHKKIGHMIDIKNIPELNVLSYDDRAGLRLGAAVSCTLLADYEPAVKRYTGLVEGAELIGSMQIQNRATIGGNVCNGSPAADTICPLIVLDARCVIAGSNGRREVHARDFMTAPGQTVLQAGELLVEFRLPPRQPRSADAYLRFIPRNEMDIAVADVATALTLDGDGRTVKAASIAIGAVASKPLLVESAGQALVGSKLEPSAVEQAAKACQAAASPISDIRGPAEYRTHLVGVLTRRTIEIASRRIQGN